MRKRLVSNVLMVTMTAMLLTACGSSSESVQEDSNVSIEQTQEVSTTATVEAQEEEKQEVQIVSETKAEDFAYTGLQDGTIEIQTYNGTAEAVVILAQIDGKDVSVIGDGCFSNNDTITSVEIPDTVKEIGTKAFINCSNLIKVKMSANIEVIGEDAFLGPKITEIDLPNTLREMKSAFAGCHLKQLNLPTSIDKIEAGTFIWNDMETLTIPGNIKSIEKQAFSSCENLKEVVLEEGVESLGEDIFQKCDALTKVTIPASVTEIDEYAFYDNIDNITIVTPAGSYAETYAAENGISCVNP